MVSVRDIASILACGLVLAGCSEGAGGEEVQRLESITVNGPNVEVDSTGSVVLRVETSIDAVCAVTYGIGEPQGSIATDRDMAPGGHRVHRVLLADLEPDTDYTYRLQGVGSDGRLYRSGIFTFRTPPATESSLGPNLARGAAVLDVSSEFSSAFAASNAVDGDPSTEWSSQDDGDDASITIDIGQAVDVKAVVFSTREMADGSALTSTFTVSVDGEGTHGPFPAGRAPVEVSFTGRVLRFDVAESTGGNTGAVEVEVYGSSSPP